MDEAAPAAAPRPPDDRFRPLVRLLDEDPPLDGVLFLVLVPPPALVEDEALEEDEADGPPFAAGAAPRRERSLLVSIQHPRLILVSVTTVVLINFNMQIISRSSLLK